MPGSLLVEVHSAVNDTAPLYIQNLFKEKDSVYDLHNARQLELHRCRTTTYGLRSVSYKGASLWNKIPNYLRLKTELKEFKSSLRTIDISSIDDRLNKT